MSIEVKILETHLLKDLPIKKRPLMFIIGAGFSYDLAKLPMLNQLGAELIEFLTEQDSSQDMWCTILERIPNSIKDNLEHLLSYLAVKNVWHDIHTHLIHKALYIRMTEIISEILNNHEKNERDLVNVDFIKLLKFWHQTETHIATFNYDTLIEKYAEKYIYPKTTKMLGTYCGWPTWIHFADERKLQLTSKDPVTKNDHLKRYDVYLSSRSDLQNIDILPLDDELKQNLKKLETSSSYKPISAPQLYQTPVKNILNRDGSAAFGFEHIHTLKLLKLHGSINWLYSGESSYPGEEIYFKLTQSHYEGGKAYKGLVPFIVPPILAKEDFYKNRTLEIQWFEAAKEIKQAYDIFFLGYSLPETDNATNFMFKECLGSKKEGCVHVFVKKDDPDLLRVKERYQKIVGDNLTLNFIEFTNGESSIKKLVECLDL